MMHDFTVGVLGTSLLLWLGGAALLASEAAPDPASSLLWYDQPAQAAKDAWMTEALPIGGGSLGGMLFGQPGGERIQFNENTLWTGDEHDTGSYQAFGDVIIDLPGGAVEGYRRELDLEQAVQCVTYRQGGAVIERSAFASHPAGVLVWRMRADRPVCSGRLWLSDMHRGMVTAAEGNHLTVSGKLSNGMAYSAQLQVVCDGGTVTIDRSPAKPMAGLPDVGALAIPDVSLVFNACRSVTVTLAAGTDYVQDFQRHWKGDPPQAAVAQRLAAAGRRSYETLLSEHRSDHRALYQRFALDLGTTPAALASQPTDRRLMAYGAAGGHDPDLEELFINYGRYLLIACSRPGGLPANLQGLWNRSNTPPWRGDYHSNINIQMNYWPALPTNLADCNLPLTAYVASLREVAAERTREQFGAVRGWTVRTENNAMGGGSFLWNPPGSAWYAQHLWEHYAFTQDRAYLAHTAYPVLKELCEFWEDRLKKRPDGTLVTTGGWSPEHGPKNAEATTYDLEIVYDLFSNYLDAAAVLGVDVDYRARVADMRNRLRKPQIGHWGQLQEWEQDIDDPKDQHRHVSHLFALYPGRQISPLTTPELAQAAMVSLRARGDAGTGWSKAWKINFWARFLDGDHAYLMLRNLLTIVGGGHAAPVAGGGVYANLFDAHPPFQIDGNFGAVAGVAEMLVQSHLGPLVLLPALPQAWPTGSVRGIRARGGFELALDWRDGRLTRVVLRSLAGQPCTLRYGAASVQLPTRSGEVYTFDGALHRL